MPGGEPKVLLFQVSFAPAGGALTAGLQFFSPLLSPAVIPSPFTFLSYGRSLLGLKVKEAKQWAPVRKGIVKGQAKEMDQEMVYT